MKKRVVLLMIAAMALMLALVAQPVYGGNNGLARAIEVQERHTDELLAIQGVVGTAVGHGPEARAAVFVFTAKRGVAGIPKKLDGVPVSNPRNRRDRRFQTVVSSQVQRWRW